MYAVIAEDPSDVECLQTLVRRMSNLSLLPMRGKGYSGCSEMLQKGAKQLRLFADLGCKRFIVCYDADGPNPASHRREIVDRIIKPSKLTQTLCLPLVPVQELEAWILADMHQAVPKVIKSWKPNAIRNPEQIASPKEHLEQLSRGSNKRPRYAHAVHNPQVAQHLEIATVHSKCLSFRPLQAFVSKSRKIQLPRESLTKAKGASVFAFVGAGDDSQYLIDPVTTAHKWGQVISHIQRLNDQPKDLTQMCEIGWADLKQLAKEIDALNKPKLNAQVKSVLDRIKRITKDCRNSRFIGLDDGTR